MSSPERDRRPRSGAALARIPSAARALLERARGLVAASDRDELERELLTALVELTGARAAELWVLDAEGRPVRRGRVGAVGPDGTPSLDAAREASGDRYAGGAPYRLGAGVVVPLQAGPERLGLAHLEGVPAEPAGGDGALELAAALAPFAALALRNLHRLDEARRAASRDPGSGAYSASYLASLASQELDRARRYGRSVSIALLAVEGGAADGAGDARHAPGASALVAAARRAMRDADVLACTPEGEHHVLLPETDHLGALVFARRVADELRRGEGRAAAAGPGAGAPDAAVLVAGTATFPRDGDDVAALLRTCRARQDERRASPARRLPAGGGFWDAVDVLLAGTLDGPGSARPELDLELLEAIHGEVGREIGRDLRARGLVYVGGPGAASALVAALPRPEACGRAGDAGVRVHVLASRAAAAESAGVDHPLVTEVVTEGDRRLRSYAFLLYLSERASYALVQGAQRAFHTCDAPLVDALVARLQAAHDLLA